MATTDTSNVATPAITVCAADKKDLQAVPGRRNWVEYLDHGVTTATSGRMRAQRGYLKGPAELTGWHYLEISIPAEMGTIPCPAPESWRNTNPT